MRYPARRGFTIVEMVVSLTLLVIVMASVFGVMTRVQRDYISQRERLKAEDTLQGIELMLTQVLRSARADPLAAGVGLLEPDPDGDGVFDDVRVRGDVGNPSDGDAADALEDVLVRLDADTIKVRWTAGGAEQPVAFPVNLLRFEYYALDGTLLASAAAAATAARVKFTVAVERPHSAVLLRRESWVYIRN